jgi:hypothetical protein
METQYALYVDTKDLKQRFKVYVDGTANEAKVIADLLAGHPEVWRIQVYAPQFIYESKGTADYET